MVWRDWGGGEIGTRSMYVFRGCRGGGEGRGRGHITFQCLGPGFMISGLGLRVEGLSLRGEGLGF
jgi:hypothetical protein